MSSCNRREALSREAYERTCETCANPDIPCDTIKRQARRIRELMEREEKLVQVARDMYEHHEASGLYTEKRDEWKQLLASLGI